MRTRQVTAVRFSGIFLSLLLCSTTMAATLYVERWGDDAAPCTKKEPCETINGAIGNSSTNGRVVVGPGNYSENVEIDVEGLKLESSAGRHATRIQADSSSADTVEITHPRVQVGRRGKGFTITGATDNASSAIHVNVSVDSPRIKIEGNAIGEPRHTDAGADTDFSNHFGIQISQGGGKIQVRYNVIYNSGSFAFFCSDCVQTLISDNRVESNDSTGFYLSTGSGISLLRNVSTANGGSGIFATSGPIHGLKLRDNVSKSNKGNGFGSSQIGDGPRVEGNIFSFQNSSGLSFRQPIVATPARVQNNLVLGNSLWGLDLTDLEGAKIDRNFSSDNGFDGINLSSTAATASLKNNSTLGNGDCGVWVNEGAHTYSRHFTRNNSGGDYCEQASGTLAGTEATSPTFPRINRARSLVGG